MERFAHILQESAERAGIRPVKQIAAQPGVKAVYRVIMHYPDLRARDVILTVKRSGIEETIMEVVYQGRFGNKPLIRRMTLEDYRAFTHVLESLAFDKLNDQMDISFYGVDLCLVERAAGGFLKSVIFSPLQAEGVYKTLLDAIHTYLPEALREVT